MTKPTYLGEFEHMVMLAVLRLGDDASGIADALERLARKGYLTARMGDPSEARGGKPKRYFSLTDGGRAALRDSGRALMRLWDGYEQLLEEG